MLDLNFFNMNAMTLYRLVWAESAESTVQTGYNQSAPSHSPPESVWVFFTWKVKAKLMFYSLCSYLYNHNIDSG